MPTKIRLQRRGKKGNPFYHIVIADVRAPRDGRFIEKIGVYDPTTQPATIEVDNDKALNWLQNGAQPTDTVRAILSYKGVLYRNHLQRGVTKGALTQEEADKKFEAWVSQKDKKVEDAKNKVVSAKEEEEKKRLAAEKEKNEARAKELAARATELTEEAETSAVATGEAPAQEAQPEVKQEEKAEEPKADAKEEPKTEEAPEKEAKEEPKAEAPKTEEKKTEAQEEAIKAEKKEEAVEGKEEAQAEEKQKGQDQ